jgi:hypothetical protein
VELTRAHVAVAVLRANLEGLRPDDAVRRLEAALAALVGDHALALARRASEGAVAGGTGACGLAPVLDALRQGRVEHLLIDPTGSYRGVVGEDELLAPAGEGGGIDLADLIVSRALATGAAVLPLTGDAAQVPTDGIGALLRW